MENINSNTFLQKKSVYLNLLISKTNLVQKWIKNFWSKSCLNEEVENKSLIILVDIVVFIFFVFILILSIMIARVDVEAKKGLHSVYGKAIKCQSFNNKQAIFSGMIWAVPQVLILKSIESLEMYRIINSLVGLGQVSLELGLD